MANIKNVHHFTINKGKKTKSMSFSATSEFSHRRIGMYDMIYISILLFDLLKIAHYIMASLFKYSL